MEDVDEGEDCPVPSAQVWEGQKKYPPSLSTSRALRNLVGVSGPVVRLVLQPRLCSVLTLGFHCPPPQLFMLSRAKTSRNL